MVAQENARIACEKSTAAETDNLFNQKRPERHHPSHYVPAQSRFFKDIFEEPDYGQVENADNKNSASGFSHQLFPFELLKAEGINDDELLESPLIPRTSSDAFGHNT